MRAPRRLRRRVAAPPGGVPGGSRQGDSGGVDWPGASPRRRRSRQVGSLPGSPSPGCPRLASTGRLVVADRHPAPVHPGRGACSGEDVPALDRSVPREPGRSHRQGCSCRRRRRMVRPPSGRRRTWPGQRRDPRRRNGHDPTGGGRSRGGRGSARARAAAAAAGTGAGSEQRFTGAAPEADVDLIAVDDPRATPQESALMALLWLRDHWRERGVRAVAATLTTGQDAGLLPWQTDPIRIVCEALEPGPARRRRDRGPS